MESGFLLNVVISQSPAVFQLLPGKDQPLLVWWNTFFVLKFCLDIINGVAALHFQGNSFSSQGLNENLHSSTQTKHGVKGRFFLNVIIGQCAVILQLFFSKDKLLLILRNSFLVLNLSLNGISGVVALDFKGNSTEL